MDSTDRPGMGALPHSDGVAFRVWAPHADGVWVVGDFNGWNNDANPLERQGDYWYADVPGARPGQGYKLRLVGSGQEFFRIDPYARQVTNSVGNGVIYDHDSFDWQGDNFSRPSQNEWVIYETHVGSFASAEGTLEQVQEKIGHFLHLGVNAVQLMPVAEFAGDKSWGYNPAHLFAVESSYGGPDALKTFVREAHKNGIAVILDVVYNHFGPSDLDLWRFDGWSENDKGGIYFYNDYRSSTPWGDTRPDYGREEVRNFIRDNALMWLRDYHIDGLRYDMTLYMRSINGSGAMDVPEGWELTRWMNDQIRAELPDRILIAEDLQGWSMVTSLAPDGAGFHSQWDARFVHPIRAALTTQDDANRSMPSVAEAVTYSYGDAFARVIYTESHDEVANGKARVPQEVDANDPTGWYAQKRSTIGAALTLTSPGIPMLFQGQEFLQGDYFRDDVPLDWAQNDDFQGIVRLYLGLIRLRRNLDGVSAGLSGQGAQVLHLNDETKVLAYHRWMNGGPNDDVVVVANMSHNSVSDYRIGMPRAGHWTLRLNSDAKDYSSDFADTDVFDVAADEDGIDDQPASASLTIPAYSVLIYTYSG